MFGWLKAHPNVVFVIYFLAVLSIHFLVNTKIGDDSWFRSHMGDNPLDFMSSRYNGWTSRVIIEFLLVQLLKLPVFVWAILDSVCLTTIAYSISRLLTKNGAKEKILSVLAMSIIPFALYGHTGWYATTLNYVFPAATLLLAFYPLKNILDGKKEKLWKYPFYILATIFTCNQEQTCAIFLGLTAVFIVFCLIKKKPCKFLIFQLLLAIASVIYIFSAPGNSIRYEREIGKWYEAYGHFGIKEKVLLAIDGTMAKLICGRNVVFMVLIAIIAYYGYTLKSLALKICAFVPAIFTGCMLGHRILSSFFPYIEKVHKTLYDFSTAKIDVTNLPKTKYFLLAIIVIVWICIGISVYNILVQKFKANRLRGILMVLILATGLASAAILAFSPTFYASSPRMYLFFNIAMICIIAALCAEAKKIDLAKGILATTAVLQWVNCASVIK